MTLQKYRGCDTCNVDMYKIFLKRTKVKLQF